MRLVRESAVWTGLFTTAFRPIEVFSTPVALRLSAPIAQFTSCDARLAVTISIDVPLASIDGEWLANVVLQDPPALALSAYFFRGANVARV